MGAEAVEIKFWCRESTGFLMYLSLPALYHLPVRKVRKVFSLMHSSPERNAEAIEQTAEWLDKEVQTAQFAEQETAREYEMGYDPTVSPKSRSPTTAHQRQRNAELAEAVRRAQQDLIKVYRLRKEFNAERKI